MSQQYKAAAAILTGAITTINAILNHSDDELHRLKLIQSLQREADYLLLVTGAGDLSESTGSVLGPATTIGGRPIGKLPRITERDLRPADDAVLNLKEEVESALFYFGPNSSSAGILANMPDLVIRGVAKKAGLTVSKDNPKELTVEFIDEIKGALLAKGLVAERGDLIPDAKLTADFAEGADKTGRITTDSEGKVLKTSLDAPPVMTVDDPMLETKSEPAPAQSPAPVDFIAKGINPKDESKKKSVGK